MKPSYPCVAPVRRRVLENGRIILLRKPRRRGRTKVIGLTGSIAMGKSTTTKALRHLGVPVHDADETVHRLYSSGGAAVPKIAALVPEAIVNGGVDRAILGKAVLGDPEKMRALEAIIHPLVAADKQRFIEKHRRNRTPQVVLDVPLLFETGGDAACDEIWVVSAPAWLQRSRVLARPGMTPAKFASILARQLPDAAKRRRADHVIPTGAGKARMMQVLRG